MNSHSVTDTKSFSIAAYTIEEVDLWVPADYRVHDKAAEIAKLLDLVQKTDKFEVKYPFKASDDVDEIKGKI